jgi:hypothetical protein
MLKSGDKRWITGVFVNVFYTAVLENVVAWGKVGFFPHFFLLFSPAFPQV